jgi:hypothetical protein
LAAANSRGTSLGSEMTFRTAKDGAPPAPVLGKSEDVSPVSGIVFFVKNGRLVPLTEGRRLPNGTLIDAFHGSLKVITSAGKKGKTYTGTFGGALFKLTQDRSALTTLRLVEGKFGVPSYASCKAKGARDPLARTALSSRALQTLRSSARGRFRTKGRFAAGTVRGTRWTTKDRCDGTWIAVQLHAVLVTDFVKHITVLVHQGQHYLAHAPKH